jgi:hypothetical protein
MYFCLALGWFWAALAMLSFVAGDPRVEVLGEVAIATVFFCTFEILKEMKGGRS